MKKRPKAPGDEPEQNPSPDRKRIMLVDDHPMMRAGLAQLIHRQPDMLLCAEAGEPAEALSLLPTAKPDLVLTDLTMPGRGGIEFIKEMIAAHAGLLILVISMHDETLYAERCLRAGASGYMMKEAGSDHLLAAMRSVLQGQVHVSPSASQDILQNISPKRPRRSGAPIQCLSDREFEILQLIGEGKSAREIAERLHLSPKTVDVHRGHIREKLDLKDATALARFAVRWVEADGRAV